MINVKKGLENQEIKIKKDGKYLDDNYSLDS